MATATLSLQQFIESNDSRHELVDGELQERHVGTSDHSGLQALLSVWFHQHAGQWAIQVLAEQDVIMGTATLRKPDVAVAPHGPLAQRLTGPPLLVIEVRSPTDRMRDIEAKCRAYEAFGVPGIWFIDPEQRSGAAWLDGRLVVSERLEVPGSPMYLDVGWLFDELDESRRP